MGSVIVQRYVVRGEVQGVGFRAYVRMVAEKMAIRGQVWNRSDGCVELLATSEDEDTLIEFGLKLWNGPGVVDEVRANDEPSFHRFESFTIEKTR